MYPKIIQSKSTKQQNRRDFNKTKFAFLETVNLRNNQKLQTSKLKRA
jgi:hypothetical protein